MIWDKSIIMEYQKITNLLYNTPIELSEFKTDNWIEINDKPWRTYNNQIRFKTSMLRLSLCDYSDAYIGTITVENKAAQD